MPWAVDGYPGIQCSAAAATMAARVAALGRAPPSDAGRACLPIAPEFAADQIAEGMAAAEPAEWFVRRGEGATAFIRERAGSVVGFADAVARAGAALSSEMLALPVDIAVLFSALRQQPIPTDPVEQLFRACEMHRERRGAMHVAAAASHGLDPCSLVVLTAAVRGTRALSVLDTWSKQARNDALRRLQRRGLVDAAGAATNDGRTCREGIERSTDLADLELIEALGPDVDLYIDGLTPIAAGVVQGSGG